MACKEAIVLVGGLGTRLRALVPDMPKPLAPVAGRPFLAWVLDALETSGIERAVLATGYRAVQVEELAGTQWKSMRICYSVEDSPLGTGGAIRRAATQLHSACAHVVNGDTYLRYDPLAFERATRDAGCALGMALARVDDTTRYGAVDRSGDVVCALHEKGRAGPGLVNAGAYFLRAEAFAALPVREAFSFETDVLAPLAAAGRVCGFVETHAFIDIGVPDDFHRAQQLFPHD